MPFATGTSRFFANVDFTLCWAQKPSTIGTMKAMRNATTEMVSAGLRYPRKGGGASTRVLNPAGSAETHRDRGDDDRSHADE